MDNLFYPLFLNPKTSLQNAHDLLKLRCLGKTKFGRLQCLHFMNDSQMVAF